MRLGTHEECVLVFADMETMMRVWFDFNAQDCMGDMYSFPLGVFCTAPVIYGWMDM